MTVEKINEVPRRNLVSQKSPNITIKADKNPLRTNIRSNATKSVLLEVSHENKNVYFQEQ